MNRNNGKFIKGVHYSQTTEFKKGRVAPSGSTHPLWKGGRTVDHRGYVLIKMREHPNAKANGYVLEHRLVMEKFLGRYLERWEVVDHINGIKDDNRIENLKLFSRQAEHIKTEGKRGVYKNTHSHQERDMQGRFI